MDCIKAPVVFPINIWFAFNDVFPVPPYNTLVTPSFKLLAFIAVNLVPEPEKLVALKILSVLFQLKLSDCIIGDVPFPTNNRPIDNVDNPVPPVITGNVPSNILFAFIAVRAAPEPANFVALKILFKLSQVKLAFCINAPVSFPTNICPDVKVVFPVPPRKTFKVPSDTFETFKDVNLAPEPAMLVAVKVLLSQVKLEDCVIGLGPFPINIWFAFIVPNPVPPCATFKIPELMLVAFNKLKPDPFPVIVPVKAIPPTTSNSTFGTLLPIPTLLS